MLKQLEAMQIKLLAMVQRAEELSDSENETTSARYENVADALNTALEAIEEAISEFATA